MTNWRDLPAGRELDRVIAERLGWRVKQDGNNFLLYPPGNVGWEGGGKTADEAWFGGALPSGLPHYSTDFNSAVSLIEALPTNEYPALTCDLAYRPDSPKLPDAENWLCDIYLSVLHDWGDGNGEVYVRDTLSIEGAPTLPMAICRAWLRWQDEGARATELPEAPNRQT